MKGIAVGFFVAAIVGPIAILCIRRTLLEGQMAGLAVGLGVAIADGMYALIAGLGLTIIFDFLDTHRTLIQFLGSLFLIFLGMKTFFEKPTSQETHIQETNFRRTILNTFLLTLTNPLTVFSFMGIFASLNLETDSYVTSIILALAVFTGSLLWWILLTSFLRVFHTKVTQNTLILINKISGALISTFGVLGILSLFTRFRL